MCIMEDLDAKMTRELVAKFKAIKKHNYTTIVKGKKASKSYLANKTPTCGVYTQKVDQSNQTMKTY